MSDIFSALSEVIVAFSPYFQWFTILIIALMLREPLTNFACVLERKITEASNFEVAAGCVKLVTNTEDARERALQRGSFFEVVGDPNEIKVLFKVQEQTLVKSTKALAVPGGCLIQMTTDRMRQDGTWSTSESLEYIPGITPIQKSSGSYTLGPLPS